MCGINAIFNDTQNKYSIIEMARSTSHRGTRTILQSVCNAKIAFNWLQITDTSLEQLPNVYGNVTVYMNGFISNFLELSEKYDIELETKCDIEFLAKFLDLFNGTKLDELNGFFAVLYFSRDHWHTFTDKYGIKQLYEYANKEGVTFISSEVKGILSMCELSLYPVAVHNWEYSLGVMNPNTIYQGVERAPKLPFYVPEKIHIAYEDAKIRLRELLDQSFKRNKTELKTGVYLSGGVDSGLIAKTINPDYCFSVDYTDFDFSESELIKKNSVGFHVSLIMNQETAMKYAEKTIDVLDDLKAGSCYTNLAIAELASKFVTVVYSGAGGDEFFGGYPHRLNKPISEVIKRNSSKETVNYKMSHFEYDLLFLDAVLVVEDRMSANFTMETRYPLLDNDVVNFALSLPDEYLQNKRILKDVSGLHEDVINGKKRGFSNPYFTNQQWIAFLLKNKL